MEKLKLTPKQKTALDTGFSNAFGKMPQRYFSAPGRTELSGNHTDHQHGCVLAGAVDLDTQAAVAQNETETLRILSEGYPMCQVSLAELTPRPEEINTTAALVRGVAAGFARMGCHLSGVDMYIRSTVLPGSGLSSSAAFEVLLGTVLNHLFFEGRASAPQVAMIGQYAENVFFGKPSGLMDQMASAVGGMVNIDFADPKAPVIRSVPFDFETCGHALCIVDTRASHADLTDEYAAVTQELKQICAFFGKAVLRQIPRQDFEKSIPALRERCGDRAVLRAMHVYRENERVAQQVAALEQGDFDAYLALMRESGYSSFMYLQNVIPAGYTAHQDVAVALALCQQLLGNRGGFRVHGGGFAGTVQAFVPYDILDSFVAGIDGALGKGACHVLSIRPQGGVPAVAE